MGLVFSRFQRPKLLLGALFVAHLTARAIAQEPADVVRQATPAYEFSAADSELLELVQHGCFNYLWNECGWPSGMAQDRRTNLLASTAGVGFQLSAIPIGVEHKWITRQQGEERAVRILKNLINTPNNNHDGVSLHFVDANTGRLDRAAGRNEASTVDHALLLAGALPAATYFGGEVAKLVEQLEARTNWQSYTGTPEGLLTMGWVPSDNQTMSGPGTYYTALWRLASDEEHLIYFLAAGASNPAFAVEPAVYYRLQRTIKQHGDMEPYVVSQNGALFTYFFSHCWIDYRDLESDDPQKFGVDAPRVDWFDNSRRAVLTHRQRCIEEKTFYESFAEDRWGLSPCMAYFNGSRLDYVVPEVQPNLSNHDDFKRGNIAPYAAGSAIMFTPQESVVALRAFRNLKDLDGAPLAWADPTVGGYGLCDSFSIDKMLACTDYVAIDVGPMILAIENARTGLIWRLFQQHPVAKRASERLGFVELR